MWLQLSYKIVGLLAGLLLLSSLSSRLFKPRAHGSIVAGLAVQALLTLPVTLLFLIALRILYALGMTKDGALHGALMKCILPLWTTFTQVFIGFFASQVSCRRFLPLMAILALNGVLPVLFLLLSAGQVSSHDAELLRRVPWELPAIIALSAGGLIWGGCNDRVLRGPATEHPDTTA